MHPPWNHVADEIEALASDRLLAARCEPDPVERVLLGHEARLLHAAADAALAGPTDAWMAHSACEGVVVHCERFVMWGIGTQADDALRALAIDAASGDGDGRDALEVLRVVLGVPLDPSHRHEPHDHAPGPRPRRWSRQRVSGVTAMLASGAALAAEAVPAMLPLL